MPPREFDERMKLFGQTLEKGWRDVIEMKKMERVG